MEKKGITLVALVVTIIILLILATVTIGLILGDNSLFGRATEGKVKTEMTQVGERLQSAGTAIIADVYQGDLAKDASNTEIVAKLQEYDATDSALITTTSLTSAGNVHTLTYTNEGFTLTYVLDLDANKSDYEIEKQ